MQCYRSKGWCVITGTGGGEEEGGRGGRRKGEGGGLSQMNVNGFAMSSRTLFVMVRFSIVDVN